MNRLKIDLPFKLALKYTDPEHLVVLADVQIDHGISVQAVGDPQNGSYEWIARTPDWIKHSDSGYGSPAVALRDGLIMYYYEAELAEPVLCRPETILTINYKPLTEGGRKLWRYQT